MPVDILADCVANKTGRSTDLSLKWAMNNLKDLAKSVLKLSLPLLVFLHDINPLCTR
jgi:hypothetical protein